MHECPTRDFSKEHTSSWWRSPRSSTTVTFETQVRCAVGKSPPVGAFRSRPREEIDDPPRRPRMASLRARRRARRATLLPTATPCTPSMRLRRAVEAAMSARRRRQGVIAYMQRKDVVWAPQQDDPIICRMRGWTGRGQPEARPRPDLRDTGLRPDIKDLDSAHPSIGPTTSRRGLASGPSGGITKVSRSSGANGHNSAT